MAQASAKCAQASECFLDPGRRSLQASLAEPRPGLGRTRAGCVLRGDTSCRREGADPDSLGRISRAGLRHRCLALGTLRRPHDGARFLTERASVKKVLEHLGLPTTGPPIAKARSPVEFDFAS